MNKGRIVGCPQSPGVDTMFVSTTSPAKLVQHQTYVEPIVSKEPDLCQVLGSGLGMKMDICIWWIFQSLKTPTCRKANHLQ